MVVMTGRVTMLGLSRWAGPGGSYRTVQRFFATVMPWAVLFWVCFRHHVYRSEETYILGGDEVVVTKAGKTTHGLDRFFASLYGKPVPGLAFFALSLVSIQRRRCSRSASSRWYAVTQKKPPARPKQQPRSCHRPVSSGTRDVQRAGRPKPRPKPRCPLSWHGSNA